MERIDLNYKTILVTGGAGFIGSNLIKRLFSDVKGATIINIDKAQKYIKIKFAVGEKMFIFDAFEKGFLKIK